MFFFIAMLAAPALQATPARVTAAPRPDVDVNLVLAVDMSGSMDSEEAAIQRRGYVDALTHPQFLSAVTTGRTGRIALAYFEWAGSIDEASLTGWTVIEGEADARAFAARIAERPVATRRGTSISHALDFAAALMEKAPTSAIRRVIDVSGDGANNMGPPVAPARDRTVAAGTIVNGLAILIRPSALPIGLDRYYADCVIGGPGAFVMPVHRSEDFAQAIRQKLVTEVSGVTPPPEARIVPAAAQDHCMIGEKLRPSFLDR
ncbi:hypothetical protein BJF93_20930 [Xaviernesmea oryzae]|uniref:DUF1194 domain-containing protein n=1 Tax=Xaviernesmea oryzae TaxID=464029 RepID=A0A1Q9B042_9HYPH|nr:DUF1194 domain-containing protein [Xaviernesmea oryzae]OLP61358.1 hypothetical protein BJF93_20930 [Xaviernesmea oryzae]